MMTSLSVFCGSSLGSDSSFADAANELGSLMAHSKIRLIYGGAKVGLMGTVADAVLQNGGQVTGVLPHFLRSKEVEHLGLTELILCNSMHERKKKMFELSKGFIAMPGGFGTLEEVVEVLTWRQLQLHNYPIGFLNVNGFYDHLAAFFETMEKNQLLKPQHRDMVIFANSASELMEKMKSDFSRHA